MKGCNKRRFFMNKLSMRDYADVFENGTVITGRGTLVSSQLATETIACLQFMARNNESRALKELLDAIEGQTINLETIEAMGIGSENMLQQGRMIQTTADIINDTLLLHINGSGYYVSAQHYFNQFQDKVPEGVRVTTNDSGQLLLTLG